MRHYAIGVAAMVLGVWGGACLALDLVRDAQPVATIVLPDEPNATEQKAADTLAKYVAEATAAKLPIVRESAKPAQGPIVSIGRTRLAAAAGITDAGLEYDGYRLRADDATLYLLGRDMPRENLPYWVGAQGTYRAAFALLEHMGFRWLQPTPAGTYLPAGKTLSVADDLNVTHNPSFMYMHGRMVNLGDWSMANNYRTGLNLYTRGGHTWVEFVPAELWDKHPEYFRMHGGKRIKPVGDNYFLCPSNPEVIELLADGLRKKFDAGYELVQLGQSDGYEPCECDTCRALDKPGEDSEQVHWPHYQAILSVYKTHPKNKVHLVIYGPTATPSARIEKYPPNTVLEIATDDEELIRTWAPKVSAKGTVYVYWMGLPYDLGFAAQLTPRLASERMRKLERLGINGIYLCGGGQNWGAEGPTYYVLGRIAGDSTLDWRAALDEYCKLTFGPKAGATMRKFYEQMYARFDYGTGSLDGGSELLPGMYPPAVLEKLHGLLELAKSQSEDNARALGWIRSADYALRHVAGMARVYHLYNAYEINRTNENLRQLGEEVSRWRAFADEVMKLNDVDPQFVRDYFPAHFLWVGGSQGSVANNARKIASPFNWDFDSLLAANVLPGKTRSQGVIGRLASAPTIDGDLSDVAWNPAPWQELGEISLGKLTAATRFRLGYDDQNLYLAAECHEPLIDRMVIKDSGHDGPVWRTECLELLIDPEATGQKLMHFIMTPSADGRYDARRGYIDDPLHPLVLANAEDTRWNPQWTHRFRIDTAKQCWTIEAAIPLASLEGASAPAPGQRWRLNVARARYPGHFKNGDGRLAEYYLWSPNFQKASFTDPSVFGDAYFNASPK